jgi:hypothetical protein
MDVVRELLAENKLPASMVIRFKPAPPIAGAAHITTLHAIFNDMKRHALWERLYDWKKLQLQVITAEVKIIELSPYSYHVASKVLCGQERRMISKEATEAFLELAPIALGYIRFLGKKHSLSGQQAVTRKYGGIDPACEMWGEAFEKYGLPNLKNLDVDDFFNAISNDREAKDARKRETKLKQEIKAGQREMELAEVRAKLQGFQLRLPNQI